MKLTIYGIRVRFGWRKQVIALICIISVISIIFSVKVIKESEAAVSFNIAGQQNGKRNNTFMVDVRPSPASITLFVRMAGKLKEHRTRFYCDLFRTAVLFWPASFGKTVVVLDEESELDHEFANNLTRQTKQHFPDRKLEVLYESLPIGSSILNGSLKSAGYNRQLWSSFFIDLYTNDRIVAWMDTDVAFVTPATQSTIFNGSKIRILGSECSMDTSWVQSWERNTEMALGYLPMLADFMTYFPVYLYRDTFTHCREYILKRFNTSNFEEAFKKFYHSGFLAPVSIVITYAWFFERDRYDWNMKICGDLTSYNKRFPVGHKIAPEHTESILSQPQTAFHVTYTQEALFKKMLAGYCLSHRAAGNQLEMQCSKHSVSVADNLVLFNHDLQRVAPGQTPCTGRNRKDCLNVLERHYNQVGLDIRNGRQIQWKDFETVETLADEVDIVCLKDHERNKVIILLR